MFAVSGSDFVHYRGVWRFQPLMGASASGLTMLELRSHAWFLTLKVSYSSKSVSLLAGLVSDTVESRAIPDHQAEASP